MRVLTRGRGLPAMARCPSVRPTRASSSAVLGNLEDKEQGGLASPAGAGGGARVSAQWGRCALSVGRHTA